MPSQYNPKVDYVLAWVALIALYLFHWLYVAFLFTIAITVGPMDVIWQAGKRIMSKYQSQKRGCK
jgi:hypothetical protein